MLDSEDLAAIEREKRKKEKKKKKKKKERKDGRVSSVGI